MNILVIGPHPDDQEIGMGGTIAKLAEQGHDVLLLDLTDGSPTPRGDRASRLLEAQAALTHLQPSPQGAANGGRVRRVLLDLKNREVQHTIASRHAVAGVIRAHQAKVLFIPHWEDAHPDHLAATRICDDARFDAKLTKVEMPTPPGFAGIGPPIYPSWVFYYDVSHLRRVARPDFCIDITGFEEKKIASVLAYASQFGATGDAPAQAGSLVSPTIADRLRWSASHLGSRIGVRAAEGFFTREPLGLTGLDGLSM